MLHTPECRWTTGENMNIHLEKPWMHINPCHDLEHIILISAGGIFKAQTAKILVNAFEALTGYQNKEVYTVISFYRIARSCKNKWIEISWDWKILSSHIIFALELIPSYREIFMTNCNKVTPKTYLPSCVTRMYKISIEIQHINLLVIAWGRKA